MRQIPTSLGLAGLCLALLGPLAVHSTCRADDEDLTKKIQQLNAITGNDNVTEKVKELVNPKNTAATEKLLKAAEEMLKTNPKAFQYNGSVIIARTSLGLKKYDMSLKFYKHCAQIAKRIQSTTKLAESFEGQIGLLYELKKYEDAEKLCQEFLELEGDDELEKTKPIIMEQMIQLQTRQGKIKDALKLTDTLIRLDENGWYFVRLKGWVLHEAGRHDESVKTYLEAITRLEKAEKLPPEIRQRYTERTRYTLSGVFVDIGQIDKAAEQLQILLKAQPNNPSYNNDLGYIWADHNMNLDESEKLIRKALDEDRKQRKVIADILPSEDRDKAAYLDSLGWVLFKKKQFAEAKKHLLEAVKDKDEGQHIEILDHLADVHMALNEKAEAIAVWKKCMEVDANTKRELKRRDEVEKKLKAAEGK